MWIANVIADPPPAEIRGFPIADPLAVTELLRIGTVAAPDLLAAAASDDAQVRAGLVRLPGRIGDSVALPFVENLLTPSSQFMGSGEGC